MNRFLGKQQGFTLIESIIYITIVSIILTAIIPFTWNVVEGSGKSAMQEEIGSNARYLSERILYEIRNSYGISSPAAGTSGSTLILCENSTCSTTTTISVSGGVVSINPNGTGNVQISSNSVNVSTLTFTNNSSSSTKNASYSLTVKQANASTTRSEFILSTTVSGSAEVRNF